MWPIMFIFKYYVWVLSDEFMSVSVHLSLILCVIYQLFALVALNFTIGKDFSK